MAVDVLCAKIRKICSVGKGQIDGNILPRAAVVVFTGVIGEYHIGKLHIFKNLKVKPFKDNNVVFGVAGGF